MSAKSCAFLTNGKRRNEVLDISTSIPIKIVSARNRNQLRKEAYMLRKKFGFEQEKIFPIMEFIELILPQIDPDFQLVLEEDLDLPGRAAETIPELHLIRVKQSIYDAACQGAYWPRTVMAHELGHYLCHAEESVTYAYLSVGERLPNLYNAEKQADIFSAELLAPIHLIDETSDYLVSKHFGVPKSVARIQMNQARKVRKRHQRMRDKRKQKENG